MFTTYLVISSSDTELVSNLIDWLNKQRCGKNSTYIRQSDIDPFELADLKDAQIEGMTIRIHSAERELQILQTKENYGNIYGIKEVCELEEN